MQTLLKTTFRWLEASSQNIIIIIIIIFIIINLSCKTC